MSPFPDPSVALAPIAVAMEMLRKNPRFVTTFEDLSGIPTFLSPIETTLDQVIDRAVERTRARLEVELDAYQRAPGDRRFPGYPPRLYETMISEAAELLNRCEAYRQEGAAVAAAAIRESFGLISRAANRLVSREATRQNDALANVQRATAYATAAEQFTDTGAATQTRGDATFYSSAALLAQVRASLANEALDIDGAQDEALKSQLTLPGGALDYIGRYRNISFLLDGDITEAYERLAAAELGMRGKSADLGVPIGPLPHRPTEANSLLDLLISWTRAGVRLVDANRLRDHQFTIHVPIGRPVESLSHEFSIREEELPKRLSGLRVLAVGLSYQQNWRRRIAEAQLPERDRSATPTNADKENRSLEVSMNLTADDTQTLAATITPPRQLFPWKSSHVSEPEAKVYLGAVGPYTGGGPVSQLSGPLIANEYPCGNWRIELEGRGIAVWGLFAGTGYAELISGLILHLTLVGRA